jgi:RES domain-containing protein
VRGLYLACCEETAWAEWLRATAEDGVPPAARLPRDMWPLDVDVADVADISAQRTLEDLRLWPLRPTQDDWPECQAVGEDRWRNGAAGLLAPSAAHEKHTVLCVFWTTPAVPGVFEVPPPTTHATIPVIPTGLHT